MNENQLTELIFSELEGEISDKDKEELHRFLDQNPQAKKLYRHFAETVEHLKSVPQIEPAPELKRKVMNSIDPVKYKKHGMGKDYNMSETRWIGRPMVKIAYAFAIGIFAGVILSTSFFFNYSKYFDVDSGKVAGTIGGINSAEMSPVEIVPIQISGTTGQIVLKSNGQQYDLELDLRIQVTGRTHRDGLLAVGVGRTHRDLPLCQFYRGSQHRRPGSILHLEREPTDLGRRLRAELAGLVEKHLADSPAGRQPDQRGEEDGLEPHLQSLLWYKPGKARFPDNVIAMSVYSQASRRA